MAKAPPSLPDTMDHVTASFSWSVYDAVVTSTPTSVFSCTDRDLSATTGGSFSATSDTVIVAVSVASPSVTEITSDHV